MKTATIDVGGMLSMLDYVAVEKQLRKMGEESVKRHEDRHCPETLDVAWTLSFHDGYRTIRAIPLSM